MIQQQYQLYLLYQYLVPEYSYFYRASIACYFGKKNVSPARVIPCTDSRFRFMHARRATHQGGTSERGDVCDRLVLCCCCCCCCYCYRSCPLCHCCAATATAQTAREGDPCPCNRGGWGCSTPFSSILERVQTMRARCHVIPECTRYCIYAIYLYQSMIPGVR